MLRVLSEVFGTALAVRGSCVRGKEVPRMLDTLAIEIANHATRIIELTGIAIITIGGFATLALFMYRLVCGYDRNEAVQ
ncbi:MAG TPA: hypothetical protein DFK09_13305, partial [Erythrobacter sp.]|nr:hypothetical protein [Erythrobacter sp.]